MSAAAELSHTLSFALRGGPELTAVRLACAWATELYAAGRTPDVFVHVSARTVVVVVDDADLGAMEAQAGVADTETAERTARDLRAALAALRPSVVDLDICEACDGASSPGVACLFCGEETAAPRPRLVVGEVML